MLRSLRVLKPMTGISIISDSENRSEERRGSLDPHDDPISTHHTVYITVAKMAVQSAVLRAHISHSYYATLGKTIYHV